jgi:ribose transport system substrate-binding protein
MTAAGLLGMAVLAGCGSSTSSGSTSGASASTAADKKMVVGVSLAGYSTDFWAAYVKYEATYAKRLGLTLNGPISANGDAATQSAQIQTMINQHVSALLVNPVDSAAISTTDALAAKAHIPVVMMDVGPTTGHIYAVVRANNVLIGQEACQYIGKQAGGAGTAAVLEGDLASINGLDRANGFIDCMKQSFPKMHVLKYATMWDSATAVNDAQTAIRAYPDLKGIYSSFSGPDQGILAAIHSAGAQKRVVLVETDGVPAELQLISAGQLAATVSQPVNGYALWGLTYAKDAIKGTPSPTVGTTTSHGSSIVNLNGSPEDALPSIFVTKANVANTALWGNTYKAG